MSVSSHFRPSSPPPGSWFYRGDNYSDAGGNRARNDWKRAKKAEANAIKNMDMALDWMTPRAGTPEAPAQPLPTGKVVAPFKRAKAYTAPPMADDPDEITPEYREKARIAREIGLANKVERAVESGALPPEYREPRRMAGR